jgi:hypothetical protein
MWSRGRQVRTFSHDVDRSAQTGAFVEDTHLFGQLESRVGLSVGLYNGWGRPYPVPPTTTNNPNGSSSPQRAHVCKEIISHVQLRSMGESLRGSDQNDQVERVHGA